MDKKEISVLFLVLGISLFFRTDYWQKNEFLFDSDPYFHIGVIETIKENNGEFPKIYTLAGYPNGREILEPEGLYYIAYFFDFLVNNLFWTIRILGVIFGLLSVLAVYFLSNEIFKNKTISFLSSILLASNLSNIYRTSNHYRGEMFFIVFFLFGFYSLIKGLKSNKLKFFILSGIIFGISSWFWNGYKFIIPILLGTYLSYNLSKELNKKLILNQTTPLLLTYLIFYISHYLNIIKLDFLHNEFLIGSVLLISYSFFLMKFKKLKLYHKLLPLIIGGVLFLIIKPALFIEIITGQGLVIANQRVYQSISELQPISIYFLTIVHNFIIFLAPIGGFLVFFSKKTKFNNLLFAFSIFFIIFSVFSLLTEQINFLKIYLNSPFFIGRTEASVNYSNSTAGSLLLSDILTSLLLFTPTILLLFFFIKDKNSIEKNNLYLLPFFYITFFIGFTSRRFSFLSSPVISIFGAVFLYYFISSTLQLFSNYFKIKDLKNKSVYYLSIFSILLFSFYLTYISMDKISNPLLNSAMNSALIWLENNSESNSTVLAFWDRGAFVESIARRATFVDSVNQMPEIIEPICSFFLTNNSLPLPADYIFVDIELILNIAAMQMVSGHEDVIITPFTLVSVEDNHALFSGIAGNIDILLLENMSFAVLSMNGKRYFSECLMLRDKTEITRFTYNSSFARNAGFNDYVTGCIYAEGNLAVWASDSALKSNLFDLLFLDGKQNKYVSRLVFDNKNAKIYKV